MDNNFFPESMDVRSFSGLVFHDKVLQKQVIEEEWITESVSGEIKLHPITEYEPKFLNWWSVVVFPLDCIRKNDWDLNLTRGPLGVDGALVYGTSCRDLDVWDPSSPSDGWTPDRTGVDLVTRIPT